MTTIKERIHSVRALIRQCESECGRKPGSIQLLAVSKGQSIDAIKQAYLEGMVDFGENYFQEAQAKINVLGSITQGLGVAPESAACASLPLRWHFIGPIQSNKAVGIAQLFAWVHSLSRKDIARKLNDARPAHLPPLQICLQVNLDDERAKSGIHPDDAADLAAYVLQLPRLSLRGLMLIPKQEMDQDKQYHSYLRLTDLLQTLNQTLPCSMDTLSMGMSQDFQSAIRAGSTFLRIGTAIFGERL